VRLAKMADGVWTALWWAQVTMVEMWNTCSKGHLVGRGRGTYLGMPMVSTLKTAMQPLAIRTV